MLLCMASPALIMPVRVKKIQLLVSWGKLYLVLYLREALSGLPCSSECIVRHKNITSCFAQKLHFSAQNRYSEAQGGCRQPL